MNPSEIGSQPLPRGTFTPIIGGSIRAITDNGYGKELRLKNGPPLAGHGAEAVRDAIAASLRTLPEQLRCSLTWDQGGGASSRAPIRNGLPDLFL